MAIIVGHSIDYSMVTLQVLTPGQHAEHAGGPFCHIPCYAGMLCPLHIAHCTLHIARCILHIAHCTLHIAHCTLHVSIARREVYNFFSALFGPKLFGHGSTTESHRSV